MTGKLSFYHPSLAEIGRHFYWTLEDRGLSRRRGEGADTRIAEGFSETREEAVEALSRAIERVDPGSKSYRKHTRFSQFDKLCIETKGQVTCRASEEAKSFARNPEKGLSWARADSASGYAARRLYKMHHKKNGSKDATVKPEDLELLGLGLSFTRADVITAFRARSKEFHPDCGGDSEIFGRLVQAKNRALADAIQ